MIYSDSLDCCNCKRIVKAWTHISDAGGTWGYPQSSSPAGHHGDWLELDLSQPADFPPFLDRLSTQAKALWSWALGPLYEPQASSFPLRGLDGKTNGAQGIGLSLSHVIALLLLAVRSKPCLRRTTAFWIPFIHAFLHPSKPSLESPCFPKPFLISQFL